MHFGRTAAVIGVVTLAATAIAQTTYDAGSQFSAATNPSPNGVWSYGYYAPNGTGPFTPYTYSGNFDGTASSINYWAGTSPLYGSVPQISHNPTDQAVSAGTVVWQPNQVVMHPGFLGEYSTLRFTAPTSGLFNLSAMFAGADFHQEHPTTDVHLFRNGAEFFNGLVNGAGPGSGPSFTQAVGLTAGDVFEVSVGPGTGPNANYFHDSTAVGFTLSRLTQGEGLVSSWTGSAGDGSFHNGGNWNSGRTPGPLDTAIFNNVYTPVVFTNSTSTAKLMITGQSTSFCDIGANRTYAVGILGSATNASAFLVGANQGDAAVLYITSGNLAPSGGGFGMVSGSIGSVIVQGPTAAYSPTGYVDIGVAGTGHLTVTGGASANLLGPVLGSSSAGAGTISVGANSTVTASIGMAVGAAGTGQLDVEAGGLLTSGGDVNLAWFLGSTGTANVSGIWNHSGGSVYVGGGFGGAGGTGTLNLNPGGFLNVSGAGNGVTNYGTVSIKPSSALTTPNFMNMNNGTLDLQGGILTIDGGTFSTAGGLFEYTGRIVFQNGARVFPNNPILLSVGRGGFGELYATSGARPSFSTVYVGVGANGNGFATISGANSALFSNGVGVGVGGGTGLLFVDSGGAVGSDSVFAGNGAAAGVGSVGKIYVTAGGTIASYAGYLGAGGGTGTATIAGTWTTGDRFEVGGVTYPSFPTPDLGTSGTLTVVAGGVLNVGSRLSVYGPGTVNLNGGQITTYCLEMAGGTFNLNGGTLSLPTFTPPTAGAFHFNSGTVAFTGDWTGDFTQVSGLLGSSGSLGASKTISVAGTASLFAPLTLNEGTLAVGALVNPGALTLNTGTFKLTNSSLEIGSAGAFGSQVTVGPGLNLRVTGAGQSLNIAADGVLNLTGGSASGTTITNAGEIDFGSPVAALGLAGQSLTNTGRIQGTGRINANLSNNANGVVSADAGQRLVFTGATSTNNSNGTISLAGGTVEFTGQLTNAAGGLISGRGTFRGSTTNVQSIGLVNFGSVGFSGGASDVYGKVTNQSVGVITNGGGGVLTFYDDVVNQGEVRTAAGARTVFLGSQSGSGSFTGFGTVENDGDLRPVNSPAIVNYGGDLVLGHTNVLHIDLGGPFPGTGYDQINVAGTAYLDGTLEFDIFNGYVPQSGDTFIVLNAGTFVGTFSSYTGLDFGNGYGLIPTFGPHGLSFTVQAVPEPGTLTLTALGAGGFVAWRRRRVRLGRS